jgi:hypothetical protein
LVRKHLIIHLLNPRGIMTRPAAFIVWTSCAAAISMSPILGPESALAQSPLGFASGEPVILDPAVAVETIVEARLERDFAAIRAYRPAFSFWENIFVIPDGYVAYGSAEDGRLLAVFPTNGNWSRDADWKEPALAASLAGTSLPSNLTRRREETARLLEQRAGPVTSNPTRGTFVGPNIARYGSFLSEWGAIYKRFGIPAEIGLSQAMIESGFNPTVRSEAGAIGFCQWLSGNWNVLKRLAPTVIEAHNQTTQAAYCAAYLTVLAAKYGSFIPALSEHHAGGTNVGRTIINGGRLGGEDVRDMYLIGSAFALDLREISTNRYREVVRTYGPRSFAYTEMVFGNVNRITELTASLPQSSIYAVRADRNIPIEEVVRRTGLSRAEVQRYNPALLRQVPRGANLYLPSPVEGFGPDVTFWHGPPTPEFAAVLEDFLRIGGPVEYWDDPGFERVLQDFQARFRATGTEEGAVMGTMLAFVINETFRSGRGDQLAEFRTSDRILRLFEEGKVERETLRAAATLAR